MWSSLPFLLVLACDPETAAPEPLTVTAVDPAIVDPLGGSRLVVTGEGFAGATGATLGGVRAAVEVRSDAELVLVSAPMPHGSGLDLVVERGSTHAVLPGAVDAWSPAELAGARLFDAAAGITAAEPQTRYEWQRLTPQIDPAWEARDGNTLTWLPAVGRFVMVAGWNPYTFGETPDVTTDEVWSSADGIAWTRDLPHGHGAFERRHSHNTVLWNGALWMIGGDTWQGWYNHDVVTSGDGVAWTEVLGPTTAEPPWAERALQTIGVFDGSLWMAGGQDLFGYPDDYVHHNDVWRTEDGVHWTEVVGDAPPSETRWAGCGVLDGLVEFHGEMWLVGCAREREDAVGHSMSNEVWSTTDGAAWRRHADPPWVGKIWPNVVVWDDKLWILFGYTYGDPANGWSAGNANEAWYSEDGETWRSLPPDAPVPGSHAQGVAVTGDALVLAGGNYTFGFGDGLDASVWRLVPHRGAAVDAWTDRGAMGLVVSAAGDARPLIVPDAFGPGAPGVHFDGSRTVLALASGVDTHPDGWTALWVARAPYMPAPWGWEEAYAPLGTVLGGPIDYGWLPRSSVGLSGGQVALVNRDDALGPYGESLFSRLTGGDGLQDDGAGDVHLAGVTQDADGTVQVWVDGARAGAPTPADHGSPRGWSRIGGSLDDSYYGPNTRLAGTLGAVIVLPGAADDVQMARIDAWARGRFVAP